MTNINESVFVPQWKRGFDDDNAVSGIQINPSTAIEQSKSRAKKQQLIAGLGMIAVLIVVFIGGLSSVRQEQTVSVEASLTLKKGLMGTVTTADYDTNTFTMTYEDSQDPQIIDAAIDQWIVTLPPGTQFLNDQPQETCFTVPDIQGSLEVRVNAPCERVVNLGDTILVEYLILTPETHRMVAKTIIGEG